MFSRLLAPIFLVLLIACGSDTGENHFGLDGVDGFDTGTPDGGTGNFVSGESILSDQVTIPETDEGTGVIYGKVLNAVTGDGIADVEVSSGSITAVSDQDGAYMLVNVPYSDRVVVNTDAPNFARQSKIVVLSEVQHAVILNPPLLSVGEEISFDPTAEQTLSSGNIEITLPANSLGREVEGSDEAATGTVTAKITNLDASSDPNLMPGDYLTDGGNYIESFGAISARFEDESGNELDLIGGATANISIPVAANVVSAETVTGKFSYSRDTGFWTNEGDFTLSGAVYEGEVGHFSAWNSDVEYSPVTISGCVEDGLGGRLPGAVVKVRGADYIGTSTAITDADGNFQVQAKESSRVFAQASIEGRLSNTVEISTGSGQSLSECMLLPSFSISVTLTWGLNPSDLDTHLVGPGIHIDYTNKGSLVSSSPDAPLMALDVDDTDSYGPEILTILRFAEPGNYVYSVHLYGGSSDIRSSPAKVELNYNGETYIFAPPGGTVDTTWEVFEIQVGDNLQVQDIIALQAWKPGTPN